MGSGSNRSNRPLKVGVQLPEAERAVPWSELLAMARRIEELGYDSLWVGDHLLYRNPGEAPRAPWEAWSLLAALAAVTSRVEVGPLVACTAFHNPAMIAKKAATIDEISGGRLILGLGAGWHEPEYDAYGFPFDHRAGRFEEAFTIIRTLLREGTIDFAGRYYRVRDCVLTPRGPRAGGPPLLVGSSGDRMLAITMPYVEYWNAWYGDFGNDLAGLAPLLAKVDAACAGAMRDPGAVVRTVAVLVGMTGSTGRAAADPGERAIPPKTGTAEELAEWLRGFARAGIGHVQVVLDPITIEAIEEFAAVLEVLDRV
jgi:alkanesulfonate monooxygenase SsuD/methylene tetrahydromethanopterin reductase-like flavin-dependent oxidoreductase (luciferase family)